jgi:hypothetical protein
MTQAVSSLGVKAAGGAAATSPSKTDTTESDMDEFP